MEEGEALVVLIGEGRFGVGLENERGYGGLQVVEELVHGAALVPGPGAAQDLEMGEADGVGDFQNGGEWSYGEGCEGA